MIEYYLNKDSEPSCCKIGDNLLKENYLSEFSKTPLDQETARQNLGIDLDAIYEKIDKKVIESGEISWDNEPTQGHTEKVLSSNALYLYLNKLQMAINERIKDLSALLNLKIENLDLYISDISEKISELEEQIDEIRKSGTGGGGASISNNFGNSTIIGISQKRLTDSINELWDKFSDITGEEYRGINLIVTPDYFAGDECNIHITATTEETNGRFEKLQIYINGNLIDTVEDVEYFEQDININKTSVLTCKATILGIEYSQSKTINKYESFWIGSGNTYSDVMKISNIKKLSNNLKGNFNIHFNNGDHLIVITGSSQDFYRVDMNGIEIPVTESTITENGNTYKVYTSVGTFKEGTFNIDVNS